MQRIFNHTTKKLVNGTDGQLSVIIDRLFDSCITICREDFW